MVQGEDVGVGFEVDYSAPLIPPVGVLPLGHHNNGCGVVLTDFVKDSVKQGPKWVEVRGDLELSVGKRVTSEVIGVGGVRVELGRKLVMLRGGEDIGGWVELEVVADVGEDDGVKHDIFVCSASVVKLRDGKCDALGERMDGASAERGLECGWAGVVVARDQRVVCLWWTRARTCWRGVVELGKSR